MLIVSHCHLVLSEPIWLGLHAHRFRNKARLFLLLDCSCDYASISIDSESLAGVAGSCNNTSKYHHHCAGVGLRC